MNLERITEIKKAARKNNIQRRKRLITILKSRIERIEKQRPKTLDEAIEIARQSKRWRKRLGKFIKLGKTMHPTHILMVNLWNKKTFFRAGTLHQMKNTIEEFPALTIAGYDMLSISEIVEISQKGGTEK